MSYTNVSARNIHYTKLWNWPALVLQSDVTYLHDITLDEGKSSVDSGSFIPGIYRVNPYSVWKEEVEGDDINFDYTYGYPTGTQNRLVLTGDYFKAFTVQFLSYAQPTQLNGIADQALQKAYGKIRETDLNLGEDLGELRETIAMIKSPAQALRKFLNRSNRRNLWTIKNCLTFLKTGRFRGMKGAEALQAATSAWLEVRYGLRPLIYLIGDLVEVATKVDERLYDPNKIRSVRAKVTGIASSTSSALTTLGTVGNGTFYGPVLKEDELTAYASVQYRQSKPMSTLEGFGLSPRSWPETAWELTRLSFVVDWAVTIGPWLATLRYKPEITILGNTVGNKLVRKVTIKSTHIHTGFETNYEQRKDISYALSASCTRTSYTRDVGVSPPLLPVVKRGQTLGLFRTIDAVALILQNIKF